MSSIKNQKSKITHIVAGLVSVTVMAVVLGGFGGSIASSISSATSKLVSFAVDITNTGYGCGTYGQANPTYGNACPLAVASSSVTNSSTAALSSSSIASSAVFASSSILTSSSSAIFVSSVVNSSSVANSSSQVASAPTISGKVYLSANFNDTTDTMGTALRAANYIPTSQPYNIAPFNYSGTEVANSIPATAVDWVLMEVVSSAGFSVQKKAVLLNNDSVLMDPASLSTNIPFNNITANGSYKVIIRHRNHIAIATNTNVAINIGANTNIDFTTNSNVKSNNQASIGTNSLGQAIYGMYKGNVTGDASISAADRNLVRNAQVAQGYYSADADLSGGVSAADRNLVRNAQVTTESL